MYENSYPKERFEKTLSFLNKYVDQPCDIFDLGVHNPFTDEMLKHNYRVTNTRGEDLDLEYDCIYDYPVTPVATAFEILEHLFSPLEVLRRIQSSKLFVTVPLDLWFAKAYRNAKDERDQHFHEFEDWQMDALVEKAGWNIIDREKWIIKNRDIGIRPILRNLTPRYYAIFAERKKDHVFPTRK